MYISNTGANRYYLLTIEFQWESVLRQEVNTKGDVFVNVSAKPGGRIFRFHKNSASLEVLLL